MLDLNNAMKRTSSMHSIPKDYLCSKPIRQFITDLIHDYSYDDYSDLSESDKLTLASILNDVAAKGQYDHECISESPHGDQTMKAFRKMLRCLTSTEDFIEILKRNTIDYYTSTMEALFYYCLEDYNQEKNMDRRLSANNCDPDEAYECYRNSL